jgi:glucose/arabinose dehydrogenase
MLLILHEIRFIIIALLCGGFLTSFIPFIFAEPSIVDHSLKIELIAEGLSSPTSMAFVDSQNILVLEKNSGDVRLVSSGYLKEQPVLELDVDSTTLTCCRGLLGIAVNNLGYTGGNKQVFLYFTAAEAGKNDNPILNKVNKYDWDGKNLLNPLNILNLPATPGPNHPGGKLTLDKKEGKLYAVIGDLNNVGLLQNTKNNNNNNKDLTDSSVIIRINSTDGSAPPDNPFASIKDAFPASQVEKYYGYGIRNSFGLAIDPVTNNLWDTENGDKDFDEINLVQPGFNSGWKKLMEPISQSDITEDDLVKLAGSKYAGLVFSWKPSLGVTDIEFFDSKNFGDTYENNVFVGDINNGNVYYFKVNGSRTGLEFNNSDIKTDLVANNKEKDELVWGSGFKGITDLETGPDGNLYVLTFDESRNGEGKIYRISMN